MNFFEYLFCRLYWWNTQVIKEKITPTSYSIAGLSGFQMLNAIPIYSTFYVLLFNSYHMERILGLSPFVVVGFIFLIINFLYFRKPKYTVLLKKFEKTPKEKKKRMDIYCIVYIASLIVINVIFFIYFRSKNLGLS